MRWKRARWVVLGLVLALAGVGATWAFRVGKSLGGAGGGGFLSVWQGISNPRGQFPGRDRITVLILGRDYDRDRRGMPHSKHSRADTIMLLSADLVQKRLSAVSIPRDTFATAPDGVSGKINGVLSRGGVELMMQTIAGEFGIYPDYYVLLKPDAVKAIVDELGGVTVETLDEMKYDDSWGDLHIDLPKGRIRINGEQAVGYVRFRQSSGRRRRRGPNLEEGDLRRAARQQQMVQAMVREALKPANIWKADRIIDTGFQQIETNLSRTQMLALATLFKDSRSEMRSGTLPGEDRMEGGVYYWVVDKPRALNLIAWLIMGDEFAGRKATKVAVYNASKEAGVARIVASMLYSEGYDAFSAGSTKELAEKTAVEYRRALHIPHAKALAQLIGAAEVRKEEIDPRVTWGPDVNIRIGKDLAKALKDRYAPIAEAAGR